MDEIRVCNRHKIVVPLIGTFAFPGAEWWCPYCGLIGGLLGTGKLIDRTPELEVKKKMWMDKSKEYLTARSRLVCSSLEWEGKRITPDQLPKKEIDRCNKVIKDWKYAG